MTNKQLKHDIHKWAEKCMQQNVKFTHDPNEFFAFTFEPDAVAKQSHACSIMSRFLQKIQGILHSLQWRISRVDVEAIL